MFKKFLHDETKTIIGLKSLGLSKPKTQEPTLKKQETTTIKKIQTLQNNDNLKVNTTSTIESSIHLNFSRQPKTLEGLFGREVKLNLNK